MLSDAKARALKPQTRPYRIADSNGLCLEVRPNAMKVWRYRYRYLGKPTIVTICEYPAMPLAAARAERDRLRVLLRAGKNPAQEARIEKLLRTSATGEGSFGAIGSEWLVKREKGGLSTGSVLRERRLLEQDLAVISKVPVQEVTAPMLLAALRKVEGRGAVETAHRARSLASRIFKYAIATGRAQSNPAEHLLGALQSPQTTHLASITEPEKIRDLLRALHSYQGSPVTRAALKLAPLTFVRPGELRTAKWADFDLENAEWRFVTSKTATPHIVPLSKQAVEILEELNPFSASRSAYVFPGSRSVHRPMSENTVNAALRYLGFDGKTITGHGFRAMARTVLDEVLGFRPDYIEHQLAHAVRDPLGRAYNRTSHLPERRRMMQAWADYLDGLRSENMLPVVKK
ncbi:MAG: DUF4102 domain-containing protein [Comamonadaceae bacterium]|nr:MAG: DUF4102 domain-containing protein [Comamonadaceae bacterium]